MCVRYTLHKPEAAAASISQTLRKPVKMPEWMEPRFNLTLTHVVPVLTEREGVHGFEGMRWGFPARDQKQLLPNAKIETVATLPTFSRSAKRLRCAIPANGFYEWLHIGRERRPHLFEPAQGDTLLLAGIWTAVPDEAPAFAVLTTTPNARVSPIHNRMPVLLNAETLALWCAPQELTAQEWAHISIPAPAEALIVREVNACVGNPRNEGPRCHEPPDPRDEQLSLL